MVQDRNRCRTGWTAGLACCPLHRSMDTCIIIKTLHRSFERGASCREVYYHFFSCKHGDIAKHRGERVVLCLPKNGGCKASRTAGCVFGGTTSSAKLSPRNFFHKASSRRAFTAKTLQKGPRIDVKLPEREIPRPPTPPYTGSDQFLEPESDM